MTWIDVAIVGAASIVVGAIAVAVAPAVGAALGTGLIIKGVSWGMAGQFVFNVSGGVLMGFGGVLLSVGISHAAPADPVYDEALWWAPHSGS